MLERKFAENLEKFLLHEPRKILLVNGARQIGKSYLIRYVGKKLFKHFVEINLKADQEGDGIFKTVRSKEDFYLQLGAMAGNNLGSKDDTLVFLDEIQSYPHLMTMLKFLNEDGKYRYVASGSQLGVALSQTPSVPIGSIAVQQMYPLDFEEFLWAMGCGKEAIESMRHSFLDRKALNESMHNYMLQQFKIYLLVGGMPDAVNKFLENRNMAQVRSIQRDIHALYKIDASQYDDERKERRDYEYMKSLYPDVAKRLLPYIEEECDRMEYDNSMMYDEYPDRLSLFRIADTISTILEQEAEKVSKDLIHVLVCNEIYKRRHGGRRGMIAFL